MYCKIFSAALVFIVFSTSNLYLQAGKRIIYQVSGMDKVEVFKDLAYKTAVSEELKMDIYITPNLSKDKLIPAVIFIHGG